MTIDDLRERTKAACQEARQVTNDMNLKPRFRQGSNMREAWEQNARDLRPWLDAGYPAITTVNKALIKFYYEGLIYYHAKQHGLKSAMLFKLMHS
jgi:hypothetical protein